MSEVTYKIKEFNQADPKSSLVEKSGHVVEFSMVGVDAHKAQMDKLVKEISGQKDLEDAKMKNIEEHHAFVQNMTDFELSTAAMYWESKKTAKACAEKLVEFAEQMKQDDAEVEEIYRQCPDLLLVPSPVEAPVAEPVAEVPVEETPVVAEPVAEAPVEEATPEGEVKPETNA